MEAHSPEGSITLQAAPGTGWLAPQAWKPFHPQRRVALGVVERSLMPRKPRPPMSPLTCSCVALESTLASDPPSCTQRWLASFHDSWFACWPW